MERSPTRNALKVEEAIAARRRIGHRALDHDVSPHTQQEPQPEMESLSIGVGSLVSLDILDRDMVVAVYIAETEKSLADLPPAIQSQLPERVKIDPAVRYDDCKKQLDNLADRLQGKMVGDTVELLNGKLAKVNDIVQLELGD